MCCYGYIGINWTGGKMAKLGRWKCIGEFCCVDPEYYDASHSITIGSDVPRCKPLGLSLPIIRPSDNDGSTQQQTGECHLIFHFIPMKCKSLKNSISIIFCDFITLQDCPLSVMERSVYSARHCFVENLHIKWVTTVIHWLSLGYREFLCIQFLTCDNFHRFVWGVYINNQDELLYLMLRCSKLIDDMEYSCYLQWFEYLITNNKPQLDLIG